MTEGTPISSQQEQQKSALELAIEEKTGETLESLRNTPIDVRSQNIEKKIGKTMAIHSDYPFLISEENFPELSHDEMEKMLDEVLKD